MVRLPNPGKKTFLRMDNVENSPGGTRGVAPSGGKGAYPVKMKKPRMP